MSYALPQMQSFYIAPLRRNSRILGLVFSIIIFYMLLLPQLVFSFHESCYMVEFLTASAAFHPFVSHFILNVSFDLTLTSHISSSTHLICC